MYRCHTRQKINRNLCSIYLKSLKVRKIYIKNENIVTCKKQQNLMDLKMKKKVLEKPV